MQFLNDHPNISHGVIAFVLVLLFVPLFYVLGIANFGWLTFAIVATYFYGRESGQNDHDVQKEGYTKTQAFFGNIVPVLWKGSNWNQFAVPAIVAFVLGMTAQYFLPVWITLAETIIR